MEQVKNRISLLRDVMKKHGISACIIPGTDPHASEYIADYWKEREWISGFDGSAGTAVITLNGAGLWTDSRYFLHAAEQLEGTSIELMKQGLPETLEILPWLATQLKAGEKVGVNPQMFSLNGFSSMKSELRMGNIQLISIDLLAEVWTVRPIMPAQPFYVFETKYSGKTALEKLALLRTEMKKGYADTFVISALDDIAWLFNIRGNDVNYNPVVIAYALVENDKATLFIAPEKLTAETNLYLKNEGVTVANYLEINDALANLPTSTSVLVDGAKLNQALFESIPAGCTIRNAMSPIFKLKSIKNEVEMDGVRCAMQKDGVALTRFFMWLEANLTSGDLSEISISNKLREFRSEQENFVGESFGTIAGYAAHGAIVHYNAVPSSDAKLKPESILLLDSGGQYLDGTTDITRTIVLGTPTSQQKTDNTLVLKGHIALAMAQFPVGTRGSQLDILARKAMWDLGLNYGHGTGHGVGHFLCVHEGPQSIRMDENPTILQPGMMISNEPGMYRTNEYGIRIENLVHVIPAQKTEFGQFLQFETLTLFPIDKKLIDWDIMTALEIEWLNNYHQKVNKSISSLLDDAECDWLNEKCAPYKID
ncbi:MAG: aminopeptidase P family protein [Paludibacter sp.]